MSFNIRALKERFSPNVRRNVALVAGGAALPVAGYAAYNHSKTPEQTINTVKQSVVEQPVATQPVAKAISKKEADMIEQGNMIDHRESLLRSKNAFEKSLGSAEQDFKNAKGDDYLTKIAVDKHTGTADIITKLNSKIDKLSSGITENSFIESINKAREMRTNIIEENTKRNLGIGLGLGALGAGTAGVAYSLSNPTTQANINAHLKNAGNYVADKAKDAGNYVVDTSKNVLNANENAKTIADLKSQNVDAQNKLDTLQKVHNNSVNLNGYDGQIAKYDKALGDMGSRISNLPEGKSYEAIKGSLTKQIEGIADKKGKLMTANENHKLFSENPNAKVQIDEPSISEALESTIHTIIKNVTSKLGR